jgi:hypothetical protein
MTDLTRLTIVIPDKAVYKNKKGYSDLDFSDCGVPEDVWALQWENGSGWIEFNDDRENEHFTGNDFPDWVYNCLQKFDEFDYIFKNPPPPTEEEILQSNKVRSEFLLAQSDWSMVSDVPLANKSEWEAYRAALREIRVNTTLEPVWPTQPAIVWL